MCGPVGEKERNEAVPLFLEKLRPRLAWLLAGPSPVRSLGTEFRLFPEGREEERHFRESGSETQQGQDAMRYLLFGLTPEHLRGSYTEGPVGQASSGGVHHGLQKLLLFKNTFGECPTPPLTPSQALRLQAIPRLSQNHSACLTQKHGLPFLLALSENHREVESS